MGSSEVHLGLAQANMNLGRMDTAWVHHEAAQELISSYDEEIHVLQTKAMLLRFDGKRKEAVAILEELSQRDPTHPGPKASRARHYLRNGDLDAAQILTDELSMLEDYRWRLKSMMLQARILHERGQKDLALALLAQPEMRRFGNRFRVDILQGQGRVEEAIASGYQAIEQEPGDLGLKLMQVELLRDADRLEEAQNQAVRALGLDPEGPAASYWYASVLWRRGDTRTALAHARVANRERPGWQAALWLEAECLQDLGEQEAADVLFAQVEDLKQKRKAVR